MKRVRTVASVIASALLLLGCSDPYRHEAGEPAPSPTVGDAQPPRTALTDTSGTVSGDARATPREAVAAFCDQWANWNWQTIGRQQGRLAALATGSLSEQLAAQADARLQDQSLRRDRVGNRGRVVGVDVQGSGKRRRAVCVAWEEQQADGRSDSEGARDHVYLARVVRVHDGWAIGAWEPQP
jgi:hypothetical protein